MVLAVPLAECKLGRCERLALEGQVQLHWYCIVLSVSHLQNKSIFGKRTYKK